MSEENLLEQSYLYQNNTTGEVSPAPLTTRQLCRILGHGVLQHVTPDTQVLLVGRYDEGWKTAKTVPVLQEACSQWYYAQSDGNGNGTHQGPHSCRIMAELLAKKEITVKTKVWSSHVKTWESINELPNLIAALEACAVQVSEDIAKDAQYDASIMTFDAKKDSEPPKDIQDELEAFLSATGGGHDEDDEEEEGFESDGGTPYVKDPRTGHWIHADLAPQKPTSFKIKQQEMEPKMLASKKRKKPKFSAKNAKCWVYVQGLPPDTDEAEVQKLFSKAGIIELDPETQRPKIKLYKHKDGPKAGTIKGDASICYARPESVELALQLLDEAPYRPLEDTSLSIRVSRAKFEQHGSTFENKPKVSNAKRKVAKLAAIQAIGWDEGDNGRITGGRKGLRIIVLKHMFQLSDLGKNEDAFLHTLEQKVRTECEQWGVVEKITVFSKNHEGVIIVKFTQPTAASTAVTEFNGRESNGRQIEALFWDGVTDYTVRNEEKEKEESEQRQEDFGKWLESQELPEELRLQVEGSSSYSLFHSSQGTITGYEEVQLEPCCRAIAAGAFIQEIDAAAVGAKRKATTSHLSDKIFTTQRFVKENDKSYKFWCISIPGPADDETKVHHCKVGRACVIQNTTHDSAEKALKFVARMIKEMTRKATPRYRLRYAAAVRAGLRRSSCILRMVIRACPLNQAEVIFCSVCCCIIL